MHNCELMLNIQAAKNDRRGVSLRRNERVKLANKSPHYRLTSLVFWLALRVIYRPSTGLRRESMV